MNEKIVEDNKCNPQERKWKELDFVYALGLDRWIDYGVLDGDLSPTSDRAMEGKFCCGR